MKTHHARAWLKRQAAFRGPGLIGWTGYKQDPAAILKTFADGGESYDELIVVRQIPVYSHCEHHLAPFFGHATVGYLPSGHIVGLSKLTRLVNCFAARLQVQERLTQQIAQSLVEHLQPKAVGVIIRCRHMCMESRGIAVAGEETVTSAMLGDVKETLAQRSRVPGAGRVTSVRAAVLKIRTNIPVHNVELQGYRTHGPKSAKPWRRHNTYPSFNFLIICMSESLVRNQLERKAYDEWLNICLFSHR